MKDRLYYFLYRLFQIQRSYAKQPVGEVDIKQCLASQLELSSCSNIIFRVKNDELNGYFTLIYRHEELKKYVFRVIEDYYSFACERSEFIETDKAVVLNSLADAERFERFIKMGSIWNDKSPVYIYLNNGEPSLLGLDYDLSDCKLHGRMKRFIREYAWCALNSYFQNSLLENREWQTVGANKTLATEALAELLGLSYMIPHAQYINLVIDGKYNCFGLYMEKALGECNTIMNSDERAKAITPDLQRELNRLNLLDTICYERDHCPENYNTIFSNKQAISISVFDNNSAQAFCPRKNISFQTLTKCSGFVTDNGLINRPYLDSDVFEKLSLLTMRQFFVAIKPYLSALPMWFCWCRICHLKRAVSRTIPYGLKLLKRDEWSDETLKTELQEQYGKTYLHSFLVDSCKNCGVD